MRWAEFLSQFNFIITYRPGAKATLLDALSRLPGSSPNSKDDTRLQHRNKTVLPREKLDPVILEEFAECHAPTNLCSLYLAVLHPEKSLDEPIREAYHTNDLAQEMTSALRDHSARRWPKRIRKYVPAL